MPPNRLTQHFRITVAALTRRRPNMVEALITSWGQMDLPAHCDIRCLIVENDEQPQTRSLVTTQPVLPNGVPLDYVLETEAGIPFGRNRAAKEALAQGADLLVFVDDDEAVAKDWLVKLIEGYRQSEAVLLGAPMLVAPQNEPLTYMQSLVLTNLTEVYQKRADTAAETATLNTRGRSVIATNNWVAQTRLFRDENIWFHEALRFSGGEDTQFLVDVMERGFTVGWIKDAYVYETIPTDRLSLRYQFRRARDQANTSFHRHMSKKPLSRYTIFLRIPGKLIQLVFLLLIIPFAHKTAPLRLARMAGGFWGKLNAAVGVWFKHYAKTTGH
ncbi:glycosyltransferase [Celeribacter sp. PS-C1]|nr:glycosyltransferase [Celeribacter sp. PS-C1]